MIDITQRLMNNECGCGSCEKCQRLYQSIRMDVARINKNPTYNPALNSLLPSFWKGVYVNSNKGKKWITKMLRSKGVK